MEAAQWALALARDRRSFTPLRDEVKERFVANGGFVGGPRAPASRVGEREFADIGWAEPGKDPRVDWVVWEKARMMEPSSDPSGMPEPTHAGIVCVHDAYLFSSNGLIRDGRGFQYSLDQPLYCWSTMARVRIMKGQKLKEVAPERHPDLFSLIRLWDYAFSHAIIHAAPKLAYWAGWLRARPQIKVLYQSEMQKWCVQQFTSDLGEDRFVRFQEAVSADRMYLPLFIHEPSPSRIVHPASVYPPLDLHPGKKPFRVLYAARGEDVRFRRVQNELVVVQALMEWAASKGLEFSVFLAQSPERDRDLVNESVLLVGPHGGALANAAFLPRGGTLMELGGTEKQLHSRPCFRQVCRASGHRYLTVEGSEFGFHKPYFTVRLEKLKRRLEEAFAEKLNSVLKSDDAEGLKGFFFDLELGLLKGFDLAPAFKGCLEHWKAYNCAAFLLHCNSRPSVEDIFEDVSEDVVYLCMDSPYWPALIDEVKLPGDRTVVRNLTDAAKEEFLAALAHPDASVLEELVKDYAQKGILRGVLRFALADESVSIAQLHTVVDAFDEAITVTIRNKAARLKEGE
ncbi:Glycosyltransferase family 61 protein [Durusdinium trenchii]|uniref:Glycosyltransferase family 61 protein n=1 Tax=Durusdinium trenchii TaxID=1381693 RepID=A0ABP0L772_9DINO